MKIIGYQHEGIDSGDPYCGAVISSILDRYGDVLLVTALVGLPLAVVIALIATRRRVARGLDVPTARRRSIAEGGAILGTAPWLWMILTPTEAAGGVQLVPGHDLAQVLSGSDSLVQVIGNLLAFAALGFFVPIRFRLARRPWLVPAVIALLAALASLSVETLQFALRLGRVSSVDDVLVNVLGAVVASLASIPWWQSRRRKAQLAASHARSAATASA